MFIVIAGGKGSPPPILGQWHSFNCIAGFFLDLFTFLCCTDYYALYKWYVASKALVLSSKSLWCHSNHVNAHASDAIVITSVGREVKDSRLSGMYQSWLFLTRLGTQSLQVFGFIRLFDEVRAELVRDISRSLRFLWLILKLFRGSKNYLAFPGFEPTHLCDPSDQRRL